MKDCTFQYATRREIHEDSGLISRAEAEELWQRYIPKFKQHLEEGEDPEMAIWIDMTTPEDFHTMASHWSSDELVIDGGRMYRKTLVG